MASGAASVVIAIRIAQTQGRPIASGKRYAAFVTLFERTQRVQTRNRRTPPFTTTRTRWRLISNRREVTLCAWLTVRPKAGPRPQISHRLAIGGASCLSSSLAVHGRRQLRNPRGTDYSMAHVLLRWCRRPGRNSGNDQARAAFRRRGWLGCRPRARLAKHAFEQIQVGSLAAA